MTNRLYRTSGFQIAILYVVLIVLTLTVLSGFVYWRTASLIDLQIQETVAAEIRGLAEKYHDEGLSGLVDTIQGRSGPSGEPLNVYILVDPQNTPIAGNLGKWPQGEPSAQGVLSIDLIRNADRSGSVHVVEGRVFDLAGGFRLFVGRDTAVRDIFRQTVVEAVAWALVPALVLCLIGGVVIGRHSLRRIDAVSAVSEDIVAGDLSRRVPLTGSGDEFDRLARIINVMLDRIEHLMTGMRLATDSLSHDLRSPLTRAKSDIEFALHQDGDAETYRTALRQTNEEIETILRTFDSLAAIARAEAGEMKTAFSRLDLSQLAQDLADIYQPIAEQAGLALNFEIAPGIAISGHRQLVAQAVSNLLENALKYTPAGGTVSLDVTRDGRAAILKVVDTGPGIADADKQRVLQRFVRLDESRSTQGSGLGLSLVAAVAKLHAASLTLADNHPGLIVELHLPIYGGDGA